MWVAGYVLVVVCLVVVCLVVLMLCVVFLLWWSILCLLLLVVVVVGVVDYHDLLFGVNRWLWLLLVVECWLLWVSACSEPVVLVVGCVRLALLGVDGGGCCWW